MDKLDSPSLSELFYIALATLLAEGLATPRAICLTQFLVDRGQPAGKASSFGKAVKSAWSRAYPGIKPPRKPVYSHGQELLVNAYFEAHLPLIEAAYVEWLAREQARDPTMSQIASQSMPAAQGTLTAYFGNRST